jgi:hypothetical protein
MPNIENLKSESRFGKRTTPTTLDREQLEYSASKLLTYGTITFAVVLGLGSITYMTVQQLKK